MRNRTVHDFLWDSSGKYPTNIFLLCNYVVDASTTIRQRAPHFILPLWRLSELLCLVVSREEKLPRVRRWRESVVRFPA
jgi:hypothetical protein